MTGDAEQERWVEEAKANAVPLNPDGNYANEREFRHNEQVAAFIAGARHAHAIGYAEGRKDEAETRTSPLGDASPHTIVHKQFLKELSERAEKAEAEISMLRGVGCSEDGDGPCGACIKCYKAGTYYGAERAESALRIAMKALGARCECDLMASKCPACEALEQIKEARG